MMPRRLLLAIAMTLVCRPARAADVAFENNLTSTPMVSPAQVYQVQGVRTDFAFGYVSEDDTVTYGTTGNSANTTRDTNVFASAVVNIRDIGGLRAGLTSAYHAYSYDHATGISPLSQSAPGSGTEMTATPVVAYPVGPIVLGVAYDATQRSMPTIYSQVATKSTFGTLRPGALYQDGTLEVGLTGSTATNTETVQEPGTLTAHGRVATGGGLVLGAILRDELLSDLGAARDRTVVKWTAEFAEGPNKLEGDVGYSTDSYQGGSTLVKRLSTVSLGASGDATVAKNSLVGAAFGYEFGSTTTDQYKVATNIVTVMLRGDVKF